MKLDITVTDGLVNAYLKSKTYFSEFEGLTKSEAIEELIEMVSEEKESRETPTIRIQSDLESIEVGTCKQIDMFGYPVDRYRVLLTYVCNKTGFKVATRYRDGRLLVTRLK